MLYNLIPNKNLFFNFFRIQKINQIFALVTSKNKKIVKFYALVAQFNISLLKGVKFFFFFNGHFALLFLNLLKKQGFIFDFFLFPQAFINLLTNSSFFFFQLGVVFFNLNRFFGNPLNYIKLLSKPSRLIFITFSQLKKLRFLNSTCINYFVHTKNGLVSVEQALLWKIGGVLLCKVF